MTDASSSVVDRRGVDSACTLAKGLRHVSVEEGATKLKTETTPDERPENM